MTAILQEVRRLDAARKRGELTEAEFARAKLRLLDEVEDADTEPTPPAPARPAVARPQAQTSAEPQIAAPDPKLVHLIVALVVGLALCLGLTALLLQDLTLALTLTGTLCAAVVVRAYTRLEE